MHLRFFLQENESTLFDVAYPDVIFTWSKPIFFPSAVHCNLRYKKFRCNLHRWGRRSKYGRYGSRVNEFSVC
jgi:hypothetical protein